MLINLKLKMQVYISILEPFFSIYIYIYIYILFLRYIYIYIYIFSITHSILLVLVFFVTRVRFIFRLIKIIIMFSEVFFFVVFPLFSVSTW